MRHCLSRALGLAAFGFAAFLHPALSAPSMATEVVPSAERETGGEADRQVDDIAEQVWQWHIESDLPTRLRLGLPVISFSDMTLAQAEADAEAAKRFMAELEAVPQQGLSHDDEITRAFLMSWLESRIDSAKDYIYVFPVTPYSGGWAFLFPQTALAGHPLATPSERAQYLTLIGEYADFIEQIAAKLELQTSRGIYLPKPALPGARALIAANAESAAAHVTPSPEKLASLSAQDRARFESELSDTIAERIEPAFARLAAMLGSDYEERAPETVGLMRYPGGPEAYRRAIRQQTGYDYSPEELHELGLQRVAALGAEMEAIRRELGFEGTQAEFHRMLRTNPRFVADSPQDVEDRYNQHVSRIEPLIGEYFSVLPEAPYGVRRLDPAQEPGQTFGYYQMPTEAEPIGLYRYNGSSLEDRSLIGAASLIFHELVPGHHFQMALQVENDDLPDIRKHSYNAAFIEGWAEYAAELGDEMGLFADPYDRYGRLAMKSFLASRLVVDTGLNALGWSLEDAREYMLANSMMSETEIASELLRYSTDLPGQALAYNTGFNKMLDLRAKAEAQLGEEFEIRAFHRTVLEQGALPMNVLEEHVDWFIAEALAKSRRPGRPAGGN